MRLRQVVPSPPPQAEKGWFRRNWKRLHQATPVALATARTVPRTAVHEYLQVPANAAKKQEIEDFQKKYPLLHSLGRLVAYGAIGMAMGKTVQYAFDRFGVKGGILAAALVGALPLVSSRFFGDRKEAQGKTGLAISLNTINAQISFPAAIGMASYLSSKVIGPLTGLAVGAAALLTGYLATLGVFYGGWGLLNLPKYRQTGFGKLRELKELGGYYIRAVSSYWKRTPAPEQSAAPLPARSFLAEFAELHGNGMGVALPFHFTWLLAGVIGGLQPSGFIPRFLAVIFTVSYWLSNIAGALFYMRIAPRVNSVVKTEEPRTSEPAR